MRPNYYEILGVEPNADITDIKQAYRRLAREYHPDVSERRSDREIKRINEAYEVLSNPRKRKAYDEHRLKERGSKPSKPKEPRVTWAEGLGGFVREFKQQVKEPPQQKMSWAEGMGGFVREIKKGMRND